MLLSNFRSSSWNSIGNTDSYMGGITCTSDALGSAFDNAESFNDLDWNNLININPHTIKSNVMVDAVTTDAATVGTEMNNLDSVSVLFPLGLSGPELLLDSVII